MKDVMELIDEKQHRSSLKLAFEKQDDLDARQLLSDLKYLDDKAFEDGLISPDELKHAIRQFRLECLKALTDTKSKISNFKKLWVKSLAENEIRQPNKLSNGELHLLKYLVGLEGELVFKKFPETLDVCCRVAFYRFRVYSLSKLIPDLTQLEQQKNKLEKIVIHYKFQEGITNFLNVIGHQKKLSEFCEISRFSMEGFIGPIFFFKVKKAREFNKLTGSKISLTKKKDFLDSVNSKTIKDTLEIIISSASSDQKNQYVNSLENKFMLRILQVKLWVFGLYQGKLDHDFGTYSIEALKQLLEIIFEQSNQGEEDLKNILFADTSSNHCILNFDYLLNTHLKRFEENGNALTLDKYYQLIEGGYSEHPNAAVRVEAANFDTAVKESLITHATNLGTLDKPRRMYKGKSGFRKFLSRVVKFLKNAANKIISFIKTLIQLLGKAIKFVFEEIKEAFFTFKRGLEFLFGNRKVSVNDQVNSDYDFDFDGYTLLMSAVTKDHLRDHSREVLLRAQSLYPTIRFVTEVIKWGTQLSTPIGWVKVLIKMAGMLKKLLLERKY